MKVLDITIDQEFGLAYVYIGTGKVDKTFEINGSINIDLKANGDVFGIEFLSTNSLNHSRESLQRDNESLNQAQIDAVLFAQERVRARLAN